MRNLSSRLTRELIKHGNLPISAEGIVRLRPEIASELAKARSVLRDEVKSDVSNADRDQIADQENDFLVACFAVGPDGPEQYHLFMMETLGAKDEHGRVKRWSKRPVSYGSFVQIQKYLKGAWGQVHNLEVERAHLRLNHEPPGGPIDGTKPIG